MTKEQLENERLNYELIIRAAERFSKTYDTLNNIDPDKGYGISDVDAIRCVLQIEHNAQLFSVANNVAYLAQQINSFMEGKNGKIIKL